MRSISLVNRLEFQFRGNVARNAIVLGDVDNDGAFELVVGSNVGEVAIFKGRDRQQTIQDLSFVSCIAIGDILNKKRNCLVIVTADGWCYIYDLETNQLNNESFRSTPEITPDLESSNDTSIKTPTLKEPKPQLVCIHIQRIPANAKNIVLGDIDNDGQIEMILGLTDRVVRSYRWIDGPSAPCSEPPTEKEQMQHQGKLVALNKWECANQIGSITLHHAKGQTSLLIAQPGGTFMRIRTTDDITHETDSDSGIDYQFLGISRMRNQNISTEILGDFRSKSEDGRPYAVATLDGTIMLVQDEVILWAMAVDHQIFALNKMDVTGNGCDDIVVCAWDGQTYVLDQERNAVRFQLNEPVQAFESGFYNVGSKVTAFAYVTFKNTVILYYDIPLEKELICRRFEPTADMFKGLDKKAKNRLVSELLYGEENDI